MQIRSYPHTRDTGETKWEPGGRTQLKKRAVKWGGNPARDGGKLEAFKSEENKSRWSEER